jgi:hypothetical protein
MVESAATYGDRQGEEGKVKEKDPEVARQLHKLGRPRMRMSKTSRSAPRGVERGGAVTCLQAG